jgi:hypothetical protein
MLSEDGKLPSEVEQEKVNQQEETTSTEPSKEVSEATAKEEVVEEKETEKEASKADDHIDEIEESNAEDAEDHHNHERHKIPFLDYHSMSMENLVGEFQRLVKNEKVQAIKKHVDEIKNEFDQKFQELLDQKREEFVQNGGNEIDFRYSSVAKRQFNELFKEYREKRDQYYKNLETQLKDNLAHRLELIEGLKGLVNVEEDINTTYNNFKEIQAQWKKAGPVPRGEYNNVWRTYHHHIEIFYDFLNLNRELRDLDFKHNLEEKLKLIEKAEALASEENIGKAFHQLQTLHKIWKEELGPVDKEKREEIWERFSNATKLIHDKRQAYFSNLEESYEVNLEAKNKIIDQIHAVANAIASTHKGVQKQISEVEQLRDQFFKAGKVPSKKNEATWKRFKDSTRAFNRAKNKFYKEIKKDQQDNLTKKRALLEIAISLKDSDDWNTTTKEMKRIQAEWKKIGHVPRKHSDKIWKEFKAACNHYFDQLHASKNSHKKEEVDNLKKKEALLLKLDTFKASKDQDKDLEAVKEISQEWNSIGYVPRNKKNIEDKFNKAFENCLKSIGFNPKEAEKIKYENTLDAIKKSENHDYEVKREKSFVKRKIEEEKSEMRQLENNLEFFSNASDDSPLVKDVQKKIAARKAKIELLKEKLKSLNILSHQFEKANEEEESSQEQEDQTEE